MPLTCGALTFMNYRLRQQRLRQQMLEHRLDGLLITHQPNIRYLTGFTGSMAMVLLLEDELLFITDRRYTLQASEQVEATLIPTEITYEQTLVDTIGQRAIRRLGFEAPRMTVTLHQVLGERLAGKVELVPTEDLVESWRLVKDDEEVAALTRAVELTSAVFAEILPEIKPGLRERELAAELEYRLRRAGADRLAFETIVASGARSARPHGIASDKRIGYNELVVLDFGIIVEGYASDMTRTLYIGTPDARVREIYQIVLEAQLNCEATMRAGMTAHQIDALTRDPIGRAGYAEYYGHSTGHGIGLEVHEAPRVAKTNDVVIPPGATVTVEPGIYVPGWGGVRIEDVVVVTSEGCRVLTPTPKELLIL